MKLEKKHWIIIGVVVAIVAVWYFFLRKKKTESSYDPNLLIFGDSSYDPAFPELGESGFRVLSSKSQLVRLPGGGVLEKQGAQCPCGDKGQTGICVKSGNVMDCRAGKVVVKDIASESAYLKGGGTSASRCRGAGGEWMDCWNDDKKVWEKCCAAKAVSAL